MVKVKVCGITRLADAALASELGASAIGFVFWNGSPRAVSLAQAAEIVSEIPADVAAIGVFVNPSKEWVGEVVAKVGLTAVQFHGDETTEFCQSVSKWVRVVRAVSVRSTSDVENAIGLPQAFTLLVDDYDTARRGGTGRTVDWIRAKTVAGARPSFLAGGLDPENVGRAIREVRPYGVDASSRLEISPGIKDHGQLRLFFAAVDGVYG